MPGLLNYENEVRGPNPTPHRLTLESVIGIAIGTSVLYLLTIVIGMPVPVIFALSFSSNIATVWMTIKILKDPFSTEKTFDHYFYLDRADLHPAKMVQRDMPD